MYKNYVIIHFIENAIHFCKLVLFPILAKPWPPFESLMGELAHIEKILESTLWSQTVHENFEHVQKNFATKNLAKSLHVS